MKICYDHCYNEIGVVIATKWCQPFLLLLAVFIGTESYKKAVNLESLNFLKKKSSDFKIIRLTVKLDETIVYKNSSMQANQIPLSCRIG